MWDVLIAGGGASGLAAACALSPDLSVLLLEKQKRVGRKLLATGNGRCNLSNARMDASHYQGGGTALEEVLSARPPAGIAGFFRDLGLMVRTDEEGRMYPRSNQAASVLDALRFTAQERGCEFRTECEAVHIRPVKGGLRTQTRSGEAFISRCVLLCMGGPAGPALGGCADGLKLLRELGHRVVPARPALAPLCVPPESVRSLKGQRLECCLRLTVDGSEVRAEDGEVLFGDGTLSGIAAMDLAERAGRALRDGRSCQVRLAILRQSPEEVQRLLRSLAEEHPERGLEDFLTGITGKRAGMEIVKRASLDLSAPAASLTATDTRGLAGLLTDWPFTVTGVKGFENAQVSAGGAMLEDFDSTLASRIVPGLFAAGEVLDVCGDCGGYNLHWAWASALTASEGIRRSLRKGRNENDRLSL